MPRGIPKSTASFTSRMEPTTHYDPRYAEHEFWQCVDSQGAVLHPTYHQRILRGTMPACPVCGGQIALPVEEPDDEVEGEEEESVVEVQA